jgi:hypothetical protein
MILKRVEKDNKIKAMYSSSTICATIFDTQTKDLTVIFNNGGQYKYPNVSLTDYTRVEISESTGSDFNTHIKKKYTNFEKLDKITDTALSAIIKEVEELKAADDKIQLEAKTKTMLDSMTRLIAGYIATGKVEKTIFKNVESSIADYNKIANPLPPVGAPVVVS